MRAIALHGSPIYMGDLDHIREFEGTMGLLRLQTNQPDKKAEIITLQRELEEYEAKHAAYLEQCVAKIVEEFSGYTIDWAQTVSSRAVQDEVRKKDKNLPNKLDHTISIRPYVAHCVRWLYESSDQTGYDADWTWRDEDWPQVTTFLAAYLRSKNGRGANIDLAKIDTFDALKEAVKDYMPKEDMWHTRHALVLLGVDQTSLPEIWRFDQYELKPARQTTAQAGTLQATILHADDERIIVHQQNEAAARAFGMGTSWCTAYQNEVTHFATYSKNLIMICDARGIRHQLCDKESEYKDSLNRDCNILALLSAHKPLIQHCTLLRDPNLLEDEEVIKKYAVLYVEQLKDPNLQERVLNKKHPLLEALLTGVKYTNRYNTEWPILFLIHFLRAKHTAQLLKRSGLLPELTNQVLSKQSARIAAHIAGHSVSLLHKDECKPFSQTIALNITSLPFQRYCFKTIKPEGIKVLGDIVCDQILTNHHTKTMFDRALEQEKRDQRTPLLTQLVASNSGLQRLYTTPSKKRSWFTFLIP